METLITSGEIWLCIGLIIYIIMLLSDGGEVMREVFLDFGIIGIALISTLVIVGWPYCVYVFLGGLVGRLKK